jgi:hypothetical protein
MTHGYVRSADIPRHSADNAPLNESGDEVSLLVADELEVLVQMQDDEAGQLHRATCQLKVP